MQFLIIGHLGSADVDEIAVGDDLVHGEDDGIEMAQEPHHDAVVTYAGKKVKNKKNNYPRIEGQDTLILIDLIFLLQKKNWLRSCLRGFQCLRKNEDEDEDGEKDQYVPFIFKGKNN